MKIAATYESGNIFQHFGRTEFFKIYEIADGAVVSAEIAGTNGNGHGALAGILQGYDIDALICGGIGAGAKNALAAVGITSYGGVTGDADQAVADFLAGKLQYDPDMECDHHDHHHGHGHDHGHNHGGLSLSLDGTCPHS